MSWSPTAKRTAGLALVHLWFKPEWRASPLKQQLHQRLFSMLTDQDDVQRLRAAEVVHFLGHGDPQPTLALIRERLELEQNSHVATVLMSRLAVFQFSHAADVDSIVARVITRTPWHAVLAPSKSSDDRESARALVQLTLWLALRPQTAVAVQLMNEWSEHPGVSGASRTSLHQIRNWLALTPDEAEVRMRAFRFAQASASSLADQIGGVTDQDRVGEACRAADALARAVYFASGAHGGNGKLPTAPQAGFAEEALPLLETLAAFRHPSIVHVIVQTADHLASVEPKTAFAVVHNAVRPDEPYCYDSLAAGVTVALIERYLAEYRELVLSDHELLTQIRSVLNAFAKVGWPSAVSLSYRLGAVFR